MNYAIIKNCPLNTGLFTRTSKDKIDWVKYGFTVDGMREAKQGRDADGDYLNIFPIMNEDKFDTQLPTLEAFCEATIKPDDSIEKVTEEQAQIIKDSIVPPVQPA